MSNFKLYLYTIDGEAVTSMIHVDDVEEFLLEHPDAVLTNRRQLSTPQVELSTGCPKNNDLVTKRVMCRYNVLVYAYNQNMKKSDIKVIVITLTVFAVFFTLVLLGAMSMRGDEFVCINEDLEICRDSWK